MQPPPISESPAVVIPAESGYSKAVSWEVSLLKDPGVLLKDTGVLLKAFFVLFVLFCLFLAFFCPFLSRGPFKGLKNQKKSF